MEVFFCYDEYMSKKNAHTEAPVSGLKDVARMVLYAVLLTPGLAYAYTCIGLERGCHCAASQVVAAEVLAFRTTLNKFNAHL